MLVCLIRSSPVSFFLYWEPLHDPQTSSPDLPILDSFYFAWKSGDLKSYDMQTISAKIGLTSGVPELALSSTRRLWFLPILFFLKLRLTMQFFKRQLSIGIPTTPGMLTSSRKRRRRIRGGREPVFPDETQKGLPSLAQSSKAAPLHLYPQIPPPPLKRPPTEPKMLC